MVESSAKSVHHQKAVIRRRQGAHVELVHAEANLPEQFKWNDHTAWSESEPVGSGRGANWYVRRADDAFVLRHFRRGGAVAKVLGAKYWFGTEEGTRSFAEFNLLLNMRRQGLPVPEPVAAGYDKTGPWYTAQLLTRRIPGAVSWSELLKRNSSQSGGVNVQWGEIGKTIAQLHAARVDHADLNAHNILLDESGQVYLIDFDKGVEREHIEGGWREANLMRLRRSLGKLAQMTADDAAKNWDQLRAAYRSEFEIKTS